MKMHPKARSIIAAMVALSFVCSGNVWAGKKNDRHAYGYSQGGHHGKNYSYNKHRKYKHRPDYYYGGHKYPHNRGYGSYYYKYDDNSDEKLLIGLLVGGLVGYAINGAQPGNPSGYDNYPPPRAQQGSAATCLQEREYQMKVIVGGREVDAYGTACLQPDGSWSRGPAQLVSR